MPDDMAGRPSANRIAQIEAIFFPRADRKLRTTIAGGEMPFLGLYADFFETTWRDAIRNWLAARRDRIDGLLRLLGHWPALGAAYLMAHVVEAYGQQQQYAVYPALATALGVPETALSGDSTRRRLWEAFRYACLRLGFDALDRDSGNGYMRDEYLHQAGLSVPCAEQLGKLMADYARLVGLPDDDDPAGIRLWRDGLLERSGLLISIRDALKADTNGYYVRAFLRALREPEPTGAPAIVRALAHGLIASGSDGAGTLQRPMAVPRVIWRDETLFVELPAVGVGIRGWHVTCGADVHAYAAGPQAQTVPLDTASALPARVRIAAQPHGIDREFVLWEDGRGNRLLAFDAAGVLVASTHLGAEELWLAPGDYTVVSRFLPTGMDDAARELDSERELYEWPLTLSPGAKIELHRGPAVIVFRASARPRLALAGCPYHDVQGTEVWAQRGLELLLELPADYLEPAGDAETVTLEVVLSLRGTAAPFTTVLRLEPDGDGRCRVALAATLDAAPTGLRLLLAELRRSGEVRALARLGAWVWIGLDTIDAAHGCHCRRAPTNLEPADADNLECVTAPGDGQVLRAADTDRRTFRTGFATGAGRIRSLVWPVTGVFANLRDYGETPVREQPLRRGGVLAVRPDSRAVLEIVASRPGTLQLGPRRFALSARGGRRQLPVANLASELVPGSDMLVFMPANGSAAETVLRLVTPHRALDFLVAESAGEYRCCFTLAGEATTLRIHAEDVIDGRTFTLDAVANPTQLCGTAQAWLRTEALAGGRWRHSLELSIERWVPGAWVLTLEAEVGGRLGRLLGNRDERCGTGFIIGIAGRTTALANISSPLVQRSSAERLQILKRTHMALRRLRGADSQPSLRWLGPLWQRLVQSLARPDEQALAELLALDERTVEDDADVHTPAEVPRYVLGAALPDLYARPAAAYAGLGDAVLGTLAALASAPGSVFGTRISQLAAAGFTNFCDIARGAVPHEFDFARYRAALAAAGIGARRPATDRQPRARDCLGPAHLPWARAALRAVLATTRYDGDDDPRPGQALHLAQALRRQSPGTLLPGLSAQLYDFAAVLGSPPPDATLDEAEALAEEHLDALAYALALLAGVCRLQARRPGTLTRCEQRFAEVLPEFDANTRLRALGWLLAAGRELFAFYLLLWELALTTETVGTSAT